MVNLHAINFFNLLATTPEMLELRILLTIAGIGIFTYYDLFNNKTIPAEICYAFVTIGVIINILFPSHLMLSLLLVLLMLAFTVPTYMMGQLGGADVFAIVGISLLLPAFPHPYLVSEIFNTLLYAFFFFITYFLIVYGSRVVKMVQERKYKLSWTKLGHAFLYSIAYGVLFVLLLNLGIGISPLILGGMIYAGIATLVFVVFRDEINATLITHLPISKISEEDVLATEVMDPKIVKNYSLPRVIKQRDIQKLKQIEKEEGISVFPIYTGYPPFMPFIALGFLISILYGNLFTV